MRINRHGKAKVLTNEEIIRLFTIGLKCSRDRALFGICLYTACRIAEARQMKYQDAFTESGVRSTITIRKAHTKRKLATRVIATHPNLKRLLEEYYRESLELAEIKKNYGDWNNSLRTEALKVICPKCQSPKTVKNGVRKDKQIYKCLDCSSSFTGFKTFRENHELIDIDSKEDFLQNESSISVSDSIISIPLKVNNIDYSALKKIYVPRTNDFGVENSVPYGLLFSNPDNDSLFPGQFGKNCLTKDIVGTIFTEACARAGIRGAGTHSLRRTTLTVLHRQGIPLKVIQEISGHKQLANLQAYLEVDDDQLDDAINSLL